MPKTRLQPLNKEEVDKIIELSIKNDFYYMLFNVAKKTGRRLGELYGVEKKNKIGEKVVGKKKVYTNEGNQIEVNKKIPIMKGTGEFLYGVKVSDIDFDAAMMKVWVLKRRQYIQDETILPPDILNLIRMYIRRNKLTQEDYLFRKVCYRQIQHTISQYGKRVGIKKPVMMHQFRHYFITELLKKGWGHDKIIKLTGHKAVASLSSYDHVVAKDLKEDALRDLGDI